jgi:beta-xylosidase
MGCETVLYPVTWHEGIWPVTSQVQGTMRGWPLPPTDMNIQGIGAFVSSPDAIDFAPGSKIPYHFLYCRFPRADSYTISAPGHPNSLRLKPSRLNLTSYDGRSAPGDQALLARRQVDTLFTYSVDIDLSPQEAEEEAGITVFLTQAPHIDLSIVLLLTPQVALLASGSAR